MDKYVGIIVKNQNDKILLFDGTFYIKVKVNKNDDIKNLIKKHIYDELEKSFFKIKKVYKNKLVDKYKEITFYLVDVGVYTNDYEFFSIDKMKDKIVCFKDRDYFIKNILILDEYSAIINSSLVLFTLIFLVDLLKIHSFLDTMFLQILFSFLVLLFFMGFEKFIKPKILNYLMKFTFNTKPANLILLFLLIIYTLKILFLNNY